MLYLFFIKNSNRNVIVGASTLTAGNIKKGVKIFNVTGTFVGIVDSSYVIYQSGSATIHGFSWKTWTRQDAEGTPTVTISSSYIRCYLGHDSYDNIAGICFDTSVIWGRKHIMWVNFKAGTNYNWGRDVVETWHIYGDTMTSLGSVSGFFLDEPTDTSGQAKLCVNDGIVTKCCGYFGTEDCRSNSKCNGPAFISMFSSSDSSYEVWGEIHKIWVQFV